MHTIRLAPAAAALSLAFALFAGQPAQSAAAADPQPSSAPAVRVNFNIPPQPLGDALAEWSHQSGLQVLRRDLGASPVELNSTRVSGEFSPAEALGQMLRMTGFTYEFVNDRTVRVAPISSAVTSSSTSGMQNSPSLSLAQATTGQSEGSSAHSTAAGRYAGAVVEEVVVTGTHLRDEEPVAPVLTFEREDFDRAGAATAQEFLATLPQNFGGSESGDTSGDALNLAFDPGLGSTVSLRGLGSSSTLVLVDGHRLAASGMAAYSDISMIPLAAVERIEVMTDGASAVYGSDAVGGVVNFIMRKDFSGAETRLRYGDTTAGGLAQRQGSQLLGTNWNTGSALVSYEYLNQSPLSRDDRDFSATATGANDGPRALIPGEERHSVSLFGRQDLASRVTASGNALYSQRDGETWTWDRIDAVVENKKVKRKQYGGGLGLTMALSDTWQAKVEGSINKSTLDATALSQIEQVDHRTTYELWSSDVQASGEVLQLPWGALKLAVGAGYRTESFDLDQFIDGSVTSALHTDELNVSSAYAEVSIPIGERGERPRAPLLVSLAGRYEDHSTFGNTLDPKFGLRWTPVKALSLYATYGTSFRAPSLFQFQESPAFNSNVIVNVASPGGPLRVLGRSGNSSDLTEETARTFTSGVEFDVPIGGGLIARLNYFDIDYSDRIQRVTANSATVLGLPAYQPLVTRRGDIPDAEFDALISQHLSGASARVLACTVPVDPATGACGTAPDTFAAIVDRRLQNFAVVRVRGLDLALEQGFEWGANRLSVDVNASYFLDFDQQVNPASASQDILDTLYNPVDFRVRAGASWSSRAWGATLAANHTAQYTTRNALFRANSSPMPLTDIPSWTTFDLVLSYRTAEGSGNAWLDDVGMSLSVTNLLDKDPPFVDDQWLGLGYDPANADPRGRLVSLVFSKRW